MNRSTYNTVLETLRGPETCRIDGQMVMLAGRCANGRIAEALGFVFTDDRPYLESSDFGRVVNPTHASEEEAAIEFLLERGVPYDFIWGMNDDRIWSADPAKDRWVHTWAQIADAVEALFCPDVTDDPEPEPEEDEPACWVSEVEEFANRQLIDVGPRNW